MKLMNIADEGAGYKAQLYELYDNAFPEQEKKAAACNGTACR